VNTVDGKRFTENIQPFFAVGWCAATENDWDQEGSEGKPLSETTIKANWLGLPILFGPDE
jgi:hypothetical protein